MIWFPFFLLSFSLCPLRFWQPDAVENPVSRNVRSKFHSFFLPLLHQCVFQPVLLEVSASSPIKREKWCFPAVRTKDELGILLRLLLCHLPTQWLTGGLVLSWLKHKGVLQVLYINPNFSSYDFHGSSWERRWEEWIWPWKGWKNGLNWSSDKDSTVL